MNAQKKKRRPPPRKRTVWFGALARRVRCNAALDCRYRAAPKATR